MLRMMRCKMRLEMSRKFERLGGLMMVRTEALGEGL